MFVDQSCHVSCCVMFHFRVTTELLARLVMHWGPFSNLPSPRCNHPLAQTAVLQLLRADGKLPRYNNAQGDPSGTQQFGQIIPSSHWKTCSWLGMLPLRRRNRYRHHPARCLGCFCRHDSKHQWHLLCERTRCPQGVPESPRPH